MKVRLLSKRPLRLALLIPILLVMLPGASIAREPAEIQLDLLVFRHNTTLPEQIDAILKVPPRPGDVIPPSVQLSAATNGDELQLARSDSLEKQAEEIEKSRHFDLLHKISWRQPVYALQDAPYVSLAPTSCCGLVQAVAKVFYERYFQLTISLLYDPELAQPELTEQDTPENKTVFINLKETMTDDKLYYLDHPLLGVVAKLTVTEETRF